MLKILAHRCGVGMAPGNSIQGLLWSWACGARDVECDLSFTADGRGIIWDAAAEDFVGYHGSAEALTHKEVRGLCRQDSAEIILPVATMLDILQRDILTLDSDFKLFFDIKYYHRHLPAHFFRAGERFGKMMEEELLCPVVARNIAWQIGLTTFRGGLDLLRRAKRLSAAITANLIFLFPWERLPEESCSFLDSITLGWGKTNHWRFFSRAARRLASEARQAGLETYCGLAKTEADLAWADKMGFDGVWVDNVEWARANIRAE